MNWKITTPPEEEPVNVAEAAIHLRLVPDDDSEDEAIIIPIITAAREYCEAITGQALAIETVTAYPDRVGADPIELPHGPVRSVTLVTVTDESGTATPFDDYRFDPVRGTVTLGEVPDGSQVAITYESGYTKKELPKTIRQAMLLLIGHWYENREAVVVGAIASIEVKTTVETLLRIHRRWWF